jgi:pyrimidine deaminase RibD-like protein
VFSNIIRIYLIIVLSISLSGCLFRYSGTYNAGQVHCSGFSFSDAPATCTVYDPILKEQVPISESDGINTVCTPLQPCTVELWYKTQCHVCQATYTDSMGNTFQGKQFNVTIESCKNDPNRIVCEDTAIKEGVKHVNRF